MDPTLTSDESDERCSPPPGYTYQLIQNATDPLWLYWDTYDTPEGRYYDVLATGYFLDYTSEGLGVYGPYLYFVTYKGPYYSVGTLERSGDTFTWSIYEHEETSTLAPAYYYLYDDSSYGHDAEGDGINYGGYSYFGEFDIHHAYYDYYYIDGWELDLAAGDLLYVTVDTVSHDTACDMALFVNDPRRGRVLWADDTFDCTYAPELWRCPSGYLTAPVEGAYQILVYAVGFCNGGTSEYELLLRREDGLTPGAVQFADEVPPFVEVPVYITESVSGTATIE